LIRDDRPFAGGRFLVCVDGSSYSYRAMRLALELAQAFGGSLYVCSAFDVELLSGPAVALLGARLGPRVPLPSGT